MKKLSFNEDWVCYKTGLGSDIYKVELPHDAMQLDSKSETSLGGINTGWYEANDYTYEKKFFIPQEYNNQEVILEFEGVYRKASIYINGNKIAYHEYGYTGFYVNIGNELIPGKENTIKVEVINHDQPNSRWYSGTGIYRPVWLYILPEKHIELEGIKISTLDYKKPKIKVDVKVIDKGNIQIEILDKKNCIARIEGNASESFTVDIDLPKAKLWSPENPYLYTCKVTYNEDIQEETFGIRTVEINTKDGFTINGERVIMRGCCIHHDNGLLGACAYDYAEKRKVRIIKESGYNAIRSAHNPCSKAMLRACDEMGMLIMDEYVDVWYIHKTKYDYATKVEENYKEDLRAMVSKDFNHPSIVLYSTGNEVSESAQKRGISLCGEFTRYLHELDESRPVTCGINIFFNFLSSIGFGVYSDKKADDMVKNPKKKKAVGSEFFNDLAGYLGADFMKFGATLYPCDLKTKDSFANMDVAGYNYGILRYTKDLKKYPNRIILGTETFCSDAFSFWEIAKKEKRIIGDFVWAGMDYLGEVGVGAWEYSEYAPRFDKGLGWVSAGSGRIDLTGKALSEIDYTKVAFELKKIAIGVIPVAFMKGNHSPSAWKMTNAIESWSWNGCEGMDAKVEVYCRAHHISLYINGKLIETKKVKKDCRVTFETKYEKGELKAVGFDENNNAIAETTLISADEKTVLLAEPEENTVTLGKDLCYVRLRYADINGITKPLEHNEIKLQVTGGKLLGFGSACPYYTNSYLSDVADTYYGEALAIIKPTVIGECVIQAESNLGSCKTKIEVIE